MPPLRCLCSTRNCSCPSSYTDRGNTKQSSPQSCLTGGQISPLPLSSINFPLLFDNPLRLIFLQFPRNRTFLPHHHLSGYQYLASYVVLSEIIFAVERPLFFLFASHVCTGPQVVDTISCSPSGSETDFRSRPAGRCVYRLYAVQDTECFKYNKLALHNVEIPCGGGLEYFNRSPASHRKRRKGRQPSDWGYNWATLLLGDVTTET
jgi:hypothetical protein